MGWFGVVVQLSSLVAFIAMFLTMSAFEEQRQQLQGLFSTCPLHWFRATKAKSLGGETVSRESIIRIDSSRLFTVSELARLDGRDGGTILCLSFLGSVFDVSTGTSYYAPGGSYSFFTGKDGSRAFITGDFTASGLIDDVSDLSPSQWVDMLQWYQFYRDTYPYVGRLIGRFYDSNGVATPDLIAAQAAIDSAMVVKKEEDNFQQRFPPCNSQWTEAGGGTVWCSTLSGGIKRDWEGVPRKFFDRMTQKTRCVCVRPTGQPSDASMPDTGRGDLEHPSLREYEGCPQDSNTCATTS